MLRPAALLPRIAQARRAHPDESIAILLLDAAAQRTSAGAWRSTRQINRDLIAHQACTPAHPACAHRARSIEPIRHIALAANTLKHSSFQQSSARPNVLAFSCEAANAMIECSQNRARLRLLQRRVRPQACDKSTSARKTPLATSIMEGVKDFANVRTSHQQVPKVGRQSGSGESRAETRRVFHQSWLPRLPLSRWLLLR